MGFGGLACLALGLGVRLTFPRLALESRSFFLGFPFGLLAGAALGGGLTFGLFTCLPFGLHAAFGLDSCLPLGELAGLALGGRLFARPRGGFLACPIRGFLRQPLRLVARALLRLGPPLGFLLRAFLRQLARPPLGLGLLARPRRRFFGPAIGFPLGVRRRL